MQGVYRLLFKIACCFSAPDILAGTGFAIVCMQFCLEEHWFSLSSFVVGNSLGLKTAELCSRDGGVQGLPSGLPGAGRQRSRGPAHSKRHAIAGRTAATSGGAG